MPGINFYPSITSTFGQGKRQIADAKSTGITEVCYFPTPTTLSERLEQYELLKLSGITYIPLVHIMSDMQPWELQFFIDVFHTTAFNVHSRKANPQLYDLSEY